MGESHENASDHEETQPTECDVERREIKHNLWGYLLPLIPLLQTIEFHKMKLFYRLGRDDEKNDIVLPAVKISRRHCSIYWNEEKSHVCVLDKSRNGTFINGRRIKNGQIAFLHHGDILSFGLQPGPSGGPPIDYGFVYYHQGTKAPVTGVVAEYNFGRELGRGSFATVFEACHKASGKLFAVKMINTRRHLAKSNHMKMFNREVDIMMSLEHPNIVRLHEIYKDENIALVLEYVQGGTLARYVLENNGLTEVDTKYLTQQICEALQYLHGKKIAHRDLKPENILLTNTIPKIVKVADFGLAKAFDDETFLKTVCGTPNYVAPEVIASRDNDQEYDNSVDSWSVGITMFFMLTNASPFNEMENKDILNYIRTRTIQWSKLEQFRISNLCLHFAQELLKDDPGQRMSLSDSLQHPWFSAGST